MSFAQDIRDFLKANGPATSRTIADALGSTTSRVSQRLHMDRHVTSLPKAGRGSLWALAEDVSPYKWLSHPSDPDNGQVCYREDVLVGHYRPAVGKRPSGLCWVVGSNAPGHTPTAQGIAPTPEAARHAVETVAEALPPEAK